jgi:dihydrodipicolinate synthase/N-acetylneuraminate lyase
MVIPAHPLALNRQFQLDERRQRALTRYYLAAGAGGVAVGVHTTQFAIHSEEVGLYRPVLALAAEECSRHRSSPGNDVIRVAGVIGPTGQATAEARLALDLGYHCGLLGLGALKDATDDELIEHAARVAEVIPIFGFYLQPAVGGRLLGYRFWRRFAEIENVVAIKIAPFDRYGTLDVIRAVADADRLDRIALYTGNDDNIVADLVTPFTFRGIDGVERTARVVGGLLGQWAVWTRRSVEILEEMRVLREAGSPVPLAVLRLNAELTDANAAIFDAAHRFRGCIAGIHEVLRGQGLLEGIWCLDPEERLSPGQAEEIRRVRIAYPHLTDDPFVQEHRDHWLAG